MRSQAGAVIGLLIVVSLFCVPLFYNLDGWDLRSDEAIYSYAVDRIIESGEWLTPRSIQVDGPFLEKPPLKFWLVAAAINAGVVPHNEIGYRALDAVMGALAFGYIYFIGWRIAGPICGVVAVLLTFSIRGIVFDHGLRSNNMEAPLFLAYCAGVYHFMRWVDDDVRPRLHAVAAAVYVALGFMTKFVAVAFLPMVFVAAAFSVPEVRDRVERRWRDWVPAAILLLVIVTPWFVYETVLFGGYFWKVILGTHVVTRLTSALDPAHLRPWHFYFTQLWRDVPHGQLALTVSFVALIVAGWRGPVWPMRLLLLWFAIPMALISLGTSKLFHYAYPFLPPLGLAAGFAAARFMIAARVRTQTVAAPHVRTRSLQLALIAIAATAIVVATATAAKGPVHVRVGGVRLLQNSTLTRPLTVAAVSLALAGKIPLAAQVLAALAIAIVMPVQTYAETAHIASSDDVRLRTIRDCALGVQRAVAGVASGVYNAARGHTHHAQYYYLSKLGAWDEPETLDREELQRRLFLPVTQTPVFLSLGDYEQLRQLAIDRAVVSLPPAVVIDDVALVLPGAYSGCALVARAAGAQPPSPR